MNIIEKSIEDLQTFKKIHVAHEYREANKVVDKLANWGIIHGEVARWMDGSDIPSKINESIDMDQILGRLGIINDNNEY